MRDDGNGSENYHSDSSYPRDGPPRQIAWQQTITRESIGLPPYSDMVMSSISPEMVHRAFKLTWVILKSPVLFPVHAVLPCCERTDILDHLCLTPVSIDFKPTYFSRANKATRTRRDCIAHSP